MLTNADTHLFKNILNVSTKRRNSERELVHGG
jgi:hypothetical protein